MLKKLLYFLLIIINLLSCSSTKKIVKEEQKEETKTELVDTHYFKDSIQEETKENVTSLLDTTKSLDNVEIITIEYDNNQVKKKQIIRKTKKVDNHISYNNEENDFKILKDSVILYQIDSTIYNSKSELKEYNDFELKEGIKFNLFYILFLLVFILFMANEVCKNIKN